MYAINAATNAQAAQIKGNIQRLCLTVAAWTAALEYDWVGWSRRLRRS